MTNAFTKGQLIEATVQQVLNSVIWLKADGQMLQARTRVPLQPGQQVLLKVAEVSPQRVNLQLQSLTPSSPPSLAGEGRGGVETLLAAWGIETDETNLTIAQALLTQAHSLHPEDIETVRALVRTRLSSTQTLTATGGRAEQLEALIYLHTHQLPINAESLDLAQHWLTSLPPLAERLVDLQSSLNDVLRQLYRFEATGQPTIDPLHDILLSVRSQLANWHISPDSSLEEVVARLTNLTIQFGTPPEAELLSSLPIISPSLPDLPAGVPEKSVGGALPLPSLLSPLERGEKGGIEADMTVSSWPRLTTAIHEALAQANLDDQTSQVLHRLAGQLDLISKDLGAIHLSNLANGLNQTPEPCYFFPIPLITPEGTRTAQLKVYGQPGQRAVNPENLRLALLLDLPTLGEMAIELTIFQRHLSGRILSGRIQTHQLVETELSQLRDSLSKLGYRIDTLTSDLLIKPASSPQRSTVNGIDVSA